MTAAIYWIREVSAGRLGIMARPRSGDWLRDEIAGWRDSGVDLVVSLLEPAEVTELELQDEPDLCRAMGMEFVSFPVPDRGVPASTSQARPLVERIVTSLRADSGVAIHCRAGIGRSSLIAGCVLLRLGVSSQDVFPALSRARGTPVPDTTDQQNWLSVFGRDVQIAL